MSAEASKQLIWKHGLSHINIGSVQEVRVPKKSIFLSVQEQDGVLTLWSQHKDSESKTEMRKVIVAYTGQSFDLSTGFKFVGTVQMSGLVYHVFTK